MNPKKNDLIAIDIAKKTLQIQTIDKSFGLNNNEEGLADLLKHIFSLKNPCVILEASGGYERRVVRMLHQKKISVCIINPARVRAFAKSEGIKAKTDPIDAKALLSFAQEKTLRLTPATSIVREEIVALLDRRSQLAASLTREKNRLEKDPQYTRKLIESSMVFIEKQLDKIDKRIEQITKNDEILITDIERLTEIKGVGRLTAETVIAYLPEIREVSRNQLVSLAGLAPYNNDSGSFSGKRYIQGGRAKVRRCLFMAARSAARYNPVIRLYVSKLIKRGKPYKCALVAAMRKMLICMQSLLKNPDFSLDIKHSC